LRGAERVEPDRVGLLEESLAEGDDVGVQRGGLVVGLLGDGARRGGRLVGEAEGRAQKEPEGQETARRGHGGSPNKGEAYCYDTTSPARKRGAIGGAAWRRSIAWR